MKRHGNGSVEARAKALSAAGIPSLHDAEIIRLHLERDGVSPISIQLVGPDARCKGGRVVTFTMERINDLRLDGEDINSQNVILDLLVEPTDHGTRLTFSPCDGLTGRITAEEVSVGVDPN